MTFRFVKQRDSEKSRIEPKDTFKFVLDTRNFEITNFWQRSNYFLVLNSGLAVGFFNLKETTFAPVLAGLGILVSMLWFFVTLGSKFWQVHWESKLRELEKGYLSSGILDRNLELFSQDSTTVKAEVKASLAREEHGLLARWIDRQVVKKPSVTLAMTSLALIFVCAWSAIFLVNIALSPKLAESSGAPPQTHAGQQNPSSSGSGAVHPSSPDVRGPTNSKTDGVVSPPLDSVFLLSSLVLAAGALFWIQSKSRLGRFVGGALMLVASLFSGLKILNIEKLISIDNVNGTLQFIRNAEQSHAKPAYTLTFDLPAFDTASATPGPSMRCALQRIGTALTKNGGLHTIVVVASADRRELRAEAKRVFASNWALAQQRGTSVASDLAWYVPAGVAILVTNSGPANTSGAVSDDRLADDRIARIQISGFGSPTPDLANLALTSWQKECTE